MLPGGAAGGEGDRGGRWRGRGGRGGRGGGSREFPLPLGRQHVRARRRLDVARWSRWATGLVDIFRYAHGAARHRLQRTDGAARRSIRLGGVERGADKITLPREQVHRRSEARRADDSRRVPAVGTGPDFLVVSERRSGAPRGDRRVSPRRWRGDGRGRHARGGDVAQFEQPLPVVFERRLPGRDRKPEVGGRVVARARPYHRSTSDRADIGREDHHHRRRGRNQRTASAAIGATVASFPVELADRPLGPRRCRARPPCGTSREPRDRSARRRTRSRRSAPSEIPPARTVAPPPCESS